METERIAHIRKTDGMMQPLREHCEHVGQLCAEAARPLRLAKTALLIGLLHDMGKATSEFKEYLQKAQKDGEQAVSPHHHAATGAIFAYRRWFCGQDEPKRRRAAQIVMLCICGHHAGLMDCANVDGESNLIDTMEQAEEPLHYRDAVQWYCENVRNESSLDLLFEQAEKEMDDFLCPHDERVLSKAFAVGMLTRLLLSLLVDADRWDSACFEYQNPLDEKPSCPDWKRLLAAFETYRENKLNDDSAIGRIRANISDQCFDWATNKPGIYKLSVPTGGGKTFSSLRYALRHAALNDRSRVFYIIPYNTILDQNAKDIREALGDPTGILEHHSNVVLPTKEEQDDYRRLTERWDSDIILTSLVQFLNACFSAPNTDARRFYRLTNAVLIFDEIQSLPKHCKTLFEQAVSFLSVYCGSTIVLCTATQPSLELVPEPLEMVADSQSLFDGMKRVRYVPQLQPPKPNETAAQELAALVSEASVLTIVNTKRTAQEVFTQTVELLKNQGIHVVKPNATYDDAAQIECRARAGENDEILCVHMSTLLCPTHRKKWIEWIEAWLRMGRRVFCISTTLIEAGINVSFPIVVRSLAGLPSIVQAAGRANRSGEYGIGTVYIWDFADEQLQYLPEIQNGCNAARVILTEVRDDTPDEPQQIETYFMMQKTQTDQYKDYPLDLRTMKLSGKGEITLYSLLSENKKSRQNTKYLSKATPLRFWQSFRMAYRAFEVIPSVTTAVIVPFQKEGKELIAALNGEQGMRERLFLLRKAQTYSVSLYDMTLKKLRERGAVWKIGDTGALALNSEFYDETIGVRIEPGEMEFL